MFRNAYLYIQQTDIFTSNIISFVVGKHTFFIHGGELSYQSDMTEVPLNTYLNSYPLHAKGLGLTESVCFFF